MSGDSSDPSACPAVIAGKINSGKYQEILAANVALPTCQLHLDTIWVSQQNNNSWQTSKLINS